MAGKLDLSNVKIGHSGLSDTIFMYRHGVNKKLMLDKRDAEADVFSAVITKLMYGAPEGGTMHITLGDKKYAVSAKPIKEKV